MTDPDTSAEGFPFENGLIPFELRFTIKKMESNKVKNEEGEKNVTRTKKVETCQMTLEMQVADSNKMIKLPEKVFRSWEIKQSSDNLADQISMITGHPKQEIVSAAIIIAANVLKKDPNLMEKILNENKPIKKR